MRLHILGAVLATLGLSACEEADMEGDWDGELDCGPAGSPDIEVEIDETDDWKYEGIGTIGPFALYGDQVQVQFVWLLDQDYAWGGQLVEVEAECTGVYENGDTFSLDCSDFDEIGWDGLDEMGAEIEGYLSTNFDCELELER